MNRVVRARVISLLAAAVLLIPAPAAQPVRAADVPEGVVEQARYVFGWNGVTAAIAEFTLALRFPEGRPTFHFEGRAETTGAVDIIWRMRDTVSAMTDGRTLVPHSFRLFRHENSKRIDLEVMNDTEEGKFRIRRTKQGRLRTGSVPSEGVYDPVSAMLLLRQKRLRKGDVETVRVLEGKRIYAVTMESLGRERIQAGRRALPAIKLRAAYRSEDGKHSSENDGISHAYIWVADQPTHEILRIEADAGLGVIFGERMEEGGARIAPAPGALKGGPQGTTGVAGL